MVWELALGAFKFIAGPVFDFLNKRVDANARIHLSDNETLQRVGSTVIEGASKADELNTRLREKEGPFAPLAIMSVVGFLMPFAWHTWQVCLDSSRWVPAIGWAWGFVPYPTVEEHFVGMWKVAALPGMFEATEHAVIQSLFIGATAAVAGLALIKGVFKR